MAVPVSTGIQSELWLEIARRAARARNDHDEALSMYIDHIVACPMCCPDHAAALLRPPRLHSAPDTSAQPESALPESALPEVEPVAVRHRGSR
ncbi:MAG TPA: hypothetical protein VG893_03910 [Terracidiphilus sp.]|nr:hypothetical protein [Terracidiphilus sp.]